MEALTIALTELGLFIPSVIRRKVFSYNDYSNRPYFTMCIVRGISWKYAKSEVRIEPVTLITAKKYKATRKYSFVIALTTAPLVRRRLAAEA